MKFFTPLLIPTCTQIFYKQLYSCTPPASVVCLCLDLYYNTHMLAEDLIVQGGLALQSHVCLITGTNLNIAIYFKYVLSMVYLKIIYIYR